MTGEGWDSASGSRRALVLSGIASLVPVAVLVAAIVVTGGHGVWTASLVDAFKTWSAITLSLLGGIRLGLALRGPGSGTQTAFAVLPAAVGWAALFLPDHVGVAILLLAHCAVGAWDSFSASREAAPAWFGNLRIVWTLLAAAAHIAFFVAIY